jgi:hypothetical protein
MAANQQLQIRMPEKIFQMLDRLTEDDVCTRREMVQRLIVNEYKRRYPQPKQ